MDKHDQQNGMPRNHEQEGSGINCKQSFYLGVKEIGKKIMDGHIPMSDSFTIHNLSHTVIFAGISRHSIVIM